MSMENTTNRQADDITISKDSLIYKFVDDNEIDPQTPQANICGYGRQFVMAFVKAILAYTVMCALSIGMLISPLSIFGIVPVPFEKGSGFLGALSTMGGICWAIIILASLVGLYHYIKENLPKPVVNDDGTIAESNVFVEYVKAKHHKLCKPITFK